MFERAFHDVLANRDKYDIRKSQISFRIAGGSVSWCGLSGHRGFIVCDRATEYLNSLPPGPPMKVEVGAIGGEDNATFTEEDGFCVNEDEGCED